MYSELFSYLKRKSNYTKVGLDVDYDIEVDDVNKKINVFFEESASKQDWKTNFNFPVRPYKHQKSCLWVHRGFKKAWKSANDIIMRDVIDVRSRTGYDVVFIGWSYGGAMCQFAVEDFCYRTNIRADVITFGAPNVFFGKKSSEYARNCCKSVIQFANRNDVVTIMPPFYSQIRKMKVGEKFNLFKLFKPNIYHMNYDEVLKADDL